MNRPWQYILTIAVLCLSLYGVFWVSDEFDAERQLFYGFFLLPGTFTYGFFFFLSITWRRSDDFFLRLFWTALILGHTWGAFLTLNAVVPQESARVNTVYKTDANKKVLTIGQTRGFFGHLYRARW